jgi:hypothetical protein
VRDSTGSVVLLFRIFPLLSNRITNTVNEDLVVVVSFSSLSCILFARHLRKCSDRGRKKRHQPWLRRQSHWGFWKEDRLSVKLDVVSTSLFLPEAPCFRDLTFCEGVLCSCCRPSDLSALTNQDELPLARVFLSWIWEPTTKIWLNVCHRQDQTNTRRVKRDLMSLSNEMRDDLFAFVLSQQENRGIYSCSLRFIHCFPLLKFLIKSHCLNITCFLWDFSRKTGTFMTWNEREGLFCWLANTLLFANEGARRITELWGVTVFRELGRNDNWRCRWIKMCNSLTSYVVVFLPSFAFKDTRPKDMRMSRRCAKNVCVSSTQQTQPTYQHKSYVSLDLMLTAKTVVRTMKV